MGAYLIDHPPRVSQYGARSSWTPGRPTGLTVVHTAESVLDLIAPDTSAEGVAEFIRTRTTYGSYHDLADSDSVLQLVPYEYGAYQDGTGSNGMALSISFALAAADWPRLTREQQGRYLRNGARAFARQQAWLAAHGYPLTPLRRITRAQSAAGQPGFISHAERDPARRTDPGAGFPWGDFLNYCAAAVAGQLEGEDEQMLSKEGLAQLRELIVTSVDDVLIEPSPGGIGGDRPRRAAAFLGRIADDAAAARQDAAAARTAAERALATAERVEQLLTAQPPATPS